MSRADDEYRRRNTRPLIGPGLLGALPEDTDFKGAPTVIDLNTEEGRQQYELERVLRQHGLPYPQRPDTGEGVRPTPRPPGAPGTDIVPQSRDLDRPGQPANWRFIPGTGGRAKDPYSDAPRDDSAPRYGRTIYEAHKRGRNSARTILAEARGKRVRVRYSVRVRARYQPRRWGGIIEQFQYRQVLEEDEFTAYVLRLEYEGETFIHFAGKGDLRFRMPLSRIIWIKMRDWGC